MLSTIDRKTIFRTMVFGVIIVPAIMFAGIAVYLYRETAEIRGMALSNAAQIELNIETIRVLREQIIRVEEEQKRRTSPVGRISEIERRLQLLEQRRR